MKKEEIIKAFNDGLISKYRMELLLLALRIKEDKSKISNKDKMKKHNVSQTTFYRLKKL